MWFKNKRNILIVLSVLLFSFSIFGCAKKITNPPPSGRTTNRTTNPNNTTGNNTLTGDNTLNARAERIAAAVNKVSGVRNSRVVISNNRALVGVDIGATTEGTMTDQLKSNIENAVKSADNQITSVAVTADPDLYTRITNVGTGIRSGKPLSEFGNEIEELFRRVVPR